MKRILIILALFFPIFIKAATCDYSKLNEYNKLSSNVDYEVTRNNDTNRYKVTIMNLYNNMYVKYNGVIFLSNSKNEVVIDNINEGENLNILIYAPLSDCDSYLKTLNISTQYYNRMYNDNRCIKYRTILNICKYEYLSYKATDTLLTSAIKNYENSYKEPEEIVEEVKEKTFLESLEDFMLSWGVQIILVLLSSLVTISIFKVQYRKVKHGI
ncbi:MAG: hypothetical protein IJK67_06250 [Bacilli bacterium]|nr:hypothetical protein [Bacilli bacterium]